MQKIEVMDVKSSRKRRVYSQRDMNVVKHKYFRHVTLNVVQLILILFCIYTIHGQSMEIRSKDDTIIDLESKIDSLEYKASNSTIIIKGLNRSLDESATVIDSLYKDLAVANSSLEEAESYISNSIAAPSNKRYSRYTDLSISEVIDEDRMNRIIDYWNERNGGNSPFAGNGKAFISASQKTGYDPIFLFAICSHESGFGTSKIARTKGNYCGIGAYDDSPYKSALVMGNTVEESITANAEWLYNNYYTKDQTTLNSMIYGSKCYSSSKEDWISGINSIMNTSSKID